MTTTSREVYAAYDAPSVRAACPEGFLELIVGHIAGDTEPGSWPRFKECWGGLYDDLSADEQAQVRRAFTMELRAVHAEEEASR